MLRTTLATLTGLFSTFALAHPGHDHAHWLSDPIHLLSVLAIVAVITTGATVYKKKQAQQKKEK